MNSKGSLTVVSGFSGAGKGTIMKALLARYPQYCLSISCTTRAPRPGEVDGKDYFFITRDEFERKVDADEFLEHAEYVHGCYGTPEAYVREKMAEGRDVILEIESQGAMIVKKKIPEAILLFVMTPTAAELEKRLIGRGTESNEKIIGRLLQAETETQRIKKYDAIIVNDTVDEAVEEMHNAIRTFKMAPSRNKAEIEAFAKELSDINRREEE
ncbi:MAG: guanylate kinase [Lachnospiraceae bacterium]|jgi:guanylate kinase|nr:guanylate kinase [Lachnospiraceae bacterium]